MGKSRLRALTWALVVVGVLMVGLGGVLAATFPWGQGATASDPGIYGPWAGRGFGPGPGPWHGAPHAWGLFHGPRFFGGGLLVAALVVLVVVLAVRLGGAPRAGSLHALPGEPGAEEILRRRFAEGQITEEQFRSLRDALRK
ncbi:MAG TPA: hypothetical protein VFI08_07000 [Spirochaetia bacterium]|nr:hypothetical protein [Spirochaetia bacterium]